MSTIEVTCIDKVMTFTNMPVVASGGINADKIKFTFDSTWDGYSKIGVFYQQKGEYYYSIFSSSDEVVIPSGALQVAGSVHFGVSGYKDGVTLTSSVLAYELREGAYTEVDDAEGADLLSVIRDKTDGMEALFNSVVDNLAYVQIEDDNAFEYDNTLQEELVESMDALIYSKINQKIPDWDASVNPVLISTKHSSNVYTYAEEGSPFSFKAKHKGTIRIYYTMLKDSGGNGTGSIILKLNGDVVVTRTLETTSNLVSTEYSNNLTVARGDTISLEVTNDYYATKEIKVVDVYLKSNYDTLHRYFDPLLTY